MRTLPARRSHAPIVAAALVAVAAAAHPLAAQESVPTLVAAAHPAPRTSAGGRATAGAMRLEVVAPVADTVTMAQLARGIPLALQVVEADGRALPTAVQWRVLEGDAAFTALAAHTDAQGYATATLGRAPWSLARPGRVVLEARARTRGMATDSVARVSFVLVRR